MIYSEVVNLSSPAGICALQPVCAVTGNARDAQQHECLSAGFNDVATKPYKLAQLIEKINALSPPTPLVLSPA